MNKNNDTIFALATPTGKSAMAIIRISGKKAHNIVKKISLNAPKEFNKATLNKIVDSKKNLIDQTITIFFKTPKSYTGENMAEITAHGGSAVIKKILTVLGNFKNCRIATAGEFTKRAFENNKLDLTQVEAIADLINSETEAQRKLAVKQLSGELSKKAEEITKKIIGVLANLEAAIDFSEENLPTNLVKKTKEQTKNICKILKSVIKEDVYGEKIRSGFSVTITGNPNTGKSSFLNKISKRDVAIVTDEPGTTRDLIEVFLDLRGLPVKFFDTAGIRKPKNLAEKIGIEKAKQMAKISDINLIFIDSIKGLDFKNSRQNELYVQSKIDVNPKLKNNKINFISSKTGEGIEELVNMIYTSIEENITIEDINVSRERHRNAFKSSLKYLENSIDNVNIDLMAEDVRSALKEISKITGKIDIEDILEIIFNDFCIGK